MDLSLEVPCGATARLILPARAKLESSYSIGTIDPGDTTEPRFASGHHEVRIRLLA